MALQKQVREELIVDAWYFENTRQMIKDNNVDRIGKIQQHPTGQRICEGMWLSKVEVLVQNNLQYENFASAIKNALILGCRKETFFCMVQLTAAKHFLLKLVCKILPNNFLNPASSTFGWMGVENSNLIFLNNLRQKCPGSKHGNNEWQDLLNMLEWLPITLPAPMKSCSKHIELSKTMPIFATSIDKVRYWVNDEKGPQTD